MHVTVVVDTHGIFLKGQQPLSRPICIGNFRASTFDHKKTAWYNFPKVQGLRAIRKTSKNFKDSSLKYFIALVEFSIFTHMIHVSYIYLHLP